METNTKNYTYADLKTAYKKHLGSKGFYVEDDEDGGLSISFTSQGLGGVYATMSRKEIQLSFDMMDLTDLAEWIHA